MQKLLLCMKWGQKYSPDYVNKLYNMVARNVTPPFEFYCFTDEESGLISPIKTLPLPRLGCNEPTKTRGKWRKVSLWGDSLYGLTGTALFLDLDSIIVSNIDSYFTYGKPQDIVLERNWARPLSGLGQTSVFRFPIGAHSHILKNFQQNPQTIADRYRYEQHYITHSAGNMRSFWPRGWTRHFRLHCLGPMPLRLMRPAIIPRGSKIITFPGGPNPSDAKYGKWKPDSGPYCGRWQHIKKTLVDRDFKNARRFLMPVDWIDQYWY